jgi:hypothetical protein
MSVSMYENNNGHRKRRQAASGLVVRTVDFFFSVRLCSGLVFQRDFFFHERDLHGLFLNL